MYFLEDKMKKMVLFCRRHDLGRSIAFAQASVGAYTTLEEPLAKQLFEQFEEENNIKVQLAATGRWRGWKPGSKP